MTATHTLIVTRVDREASDPPEIDYRLDGPHDKDCALWQPCRTCSAIPGPYDDTVDDDLGGVEDRDMHGIAHQFIAGDWMVEKGPCGGEYASDDLYDIASDKGVGTHPVVVFYEGDESWRAEESR